MAWFLPRYPFIVNGIVDVDDFNDNLSLAAHESAFLSEANWDTSTHASAQLAIDTVAEDSAMTMHSLVTKLDPHAGGVAIPQSLGWLEVPGTAKTFRSKGGRIEVDISYQIRNNPGSTSSDQTGLMFAISLDGTPRMESLIGSGDLGNDQTQAPVNQYHPAAGSFNAVATAFYGTGPAIKATQIGLVNHLSISIEPGEHTVALAVRNLALDSDSIVQFISQRVVYIKEIWA